MCPAQIKTNKLKKNQTENKKSVSTCHADAVELGLCLSDPLDKLAIRSLSASIGEFEDDLSRFEEVSIWLWQFAIPTTLLGLLLLL